MSSNNILKDNLNSLYNITQSSFLVYPKQMIITTLRDYFSKSDYYHYQADQWGFPNVTDHTDLPLGADLPSGPGARPELSLTNPLSTRLFIGENYHFSGIYYPAILVKSAGGKYVPVSINREKGSIFYEDLVFTDGYNEKVVSSPKHFITAGFFDTNITIDVLTRSLRSRDDLIEHIAMCFTEVNFESLVDVGIVVRPLSFSATSERDDRSDKLFMQSISLDIHFEWRREIPISGIVEAIVFTVQFKDLNNPNSIISPNLTIVTENSLLDNILNLPVI